LHATRLAQWNSRLRASRQLPGLSDEEAEGIVRGELGMKAKPAVVRELVKGAREVAISSKGNKEYLNARRLFDALKDLKAPMAQEMSA